jgi:hypothetical protein
MLEHHQLLRPPYRTTYWSLISGDRSDGGCTARRTPGSSTSHFPSVSVEAAPALWTVRRREFQARTSGRQTRSRYTPMYHLGSNTYLAPRHTSRTTVRAKSPTRSAGVGPRIACATGQHNKVSVSDRWQLATPDHQQGVERLRTSLSSWSTFISPSLVRIFPLVISDSTTPGTTSVMRMSLPSSIRRVS